MSDWPRLIHEHDHGRETIRIEVECDDDLVLHITGQDKDPDTSRVQAVGTTITFESTNVETWCYLPETAVTRLRDACDAWLALSPGTTA